MIPPLFRQTGSRNLTGQKTLPMIWGIYMKLVTKYQISAINSCWEKCDEKCAYMFNVYKNQQSRQTGSRNLTGPKAFPTIRQTFWNSSDHQTERAENHKDRQYWQVCRSGCMTFLYTLNMYAHFLSHFSQQLLMAEIWYFITIFILVCNIVGSVFGPVGFLLPVCRPSWFLYTLNIYAHF
jgi:hypothetical protein